MKNIVVKLPFNSTDFEIKWYEWINYRSEIKKPYKSNNSVQKLLDWLGGFDEQTAIGMIDQSIRNEWQGIFELKTKSNANHTSKTNTANHSGQDNSRLKGALSIIGSKNMG